jgi:hypothetical protein
MFIRIFNSTKMGMNVRRYTGMDVLKTLQNGIKKKIPS